MKALGWKKFVLAGLAFTPLAANAGFIATIDGNDCVGVFGTPFADCKIPTQYDLNQSPVIIKFDVSEGDDGNFLLPEINPLFPSITGLEFVFSGMSDDKGTGTWTYTPGTGDPLINFFVAKAASNFNLFSNLGDPNSDTWSTPLNQQEVPRGLSHITFYDTGSNGGGDDDEIPEPGVLFLMGAGLLGLGLARRRKSA